MSRSLSGLILFLLNNTMKRLLSAVLVLLCGITLLQAQSKNQKYVSYIEQYKDIAVSEMYRSGIPASITLAQGLLESGAGMSQLAVKSNNHFGIKCHNGWQGGKVYHDDDAKGECFRKYDNPEESYRDHSDFLRYRDRYKFLFEYEITDYKSWANGLKKAGYATDPAYPGKLISIIEQYGLSQYDLTNVSSSSGQDAPRNLPAPPSQIDQVQRIRKPAKEVFRFSLSREVFSVNGVPFIYANAGETYAGIADSYGLFRGELLKFNDLTGNPQLDEGTVVYLQKKKKYAAHGLERHVVEKGETLRSISQKYAVRVSALRKLNGLTKTSVIKENDILRLRK